MNNLVQTDALSLQRDCFVKRKRELNDVKYDNVKFKK